MKTDKTCVSIHKPAKGVCLLANTSSQDYLCMTVSDQTTGSGLSSGEILQDE